MNKTAELVALWADYEIDHPDADISQFCRAYLASQGPTASSVTFWHSPLPPDQTSVLTKLIGRIAKLHSIQVLKSFSDLGISNFDEFLYLNSVVSTASPKKTEVIFANFNELSSGLLILDRLKKANLIVEKADDTDKRVKRLTITEAGETALNACYQKLYELSRLCFGGLSQEQVALCTQWLQPVEAALAAQWLADKKLST